MQEAYVASTFVPQRATSALPRDGRSTVVKRRCRLSPPRSARMSASGSGDEPADLPSTSWREMRAQLYAGSAAAFEKQKKNAYREGFWAHPISLPESGCFLASHPAYFRRDAAYMTQSVVFLISYSAAAGATGLVLNRPLHGAATANFPAEVRDLLGSQYVYLGGPDTFNGSPLLVLHSDGRAAAGGSGVLEPLPGVFIDSLATTRGRLAITSTSQNADQRVFAGCVRWPPGQLDAEVDTGEWFCASASSKFATSHCIQLPRPLWCELMEAQGDPFAKIARRLYGNEE